MTEPDHCTLNLGPDVKAFSLTEILRGMAPFAGRGGLDGGRGRPYPCLAFGCRPVMPPYGARMKTGSLVTTLPVGTTKVARL